MKELQGQFKTDFENWYIEKYHNLPKSNMLALGDYYRQPIEMQWGVVQLFSDVVQFDLQEAFNNEEFMQAHQSSGSYFDRSEAQQEAITQFEKWHNEQR